MWKAERITCYWYDFDKNYEKAQFEVVTQKLKEKHKPEQLGVSSDLLRKLTAADYRFTAMTTTLVLSWRRNSGDTNEVRGRQTVHGQVTHGPACTARKRGDWMFWTLILRMRTGS